MLGGHIDEALHVDGLAIVGVALECEVAGTLEVLRSALDDELVAAQRQLELHAIVKDKVIAQRDFAGNLDRLVGLGVAQMHAHGDRLAAVAIDGGQFELAFELSGWRLHGAVLRTAIRAMIDNQRSIDAVWARVSWLYLALVSASFLFSAVQGHRQRPHREHVAEKWNVFAALYAIGQHAQRERFTRLITPARSSP